MSESTFSTNCLAELTLHSHQRSSTSTCVRRNQNFDSGLGRDKSVILSKNAKRATSARPEKLSCSGVLIDSTEGLVLTHGSLLSAYFTKSTCKVERRENVDFVRFAGRSQEVHYTLKVLLHTNKTENYRNERRELRVFTAEPQMAWSCPNFKNIVDTLLPKSDGWRFDDLESNVSSVGMVTDEAKQHYLNYDEQAIHPVLSKSDVTRNPQMLLSWFALLKINDWEKLHARTDIITTIPSSHVQRGNPVVTIATPFASVCPLVFFNSMSKGIVTNVAGEDSALIMTDARCLPGTEGGAVYSVDISSKSRHLIGLIVAPLCWKSNEWIGLTLASSISEILNSLSQISFDSNVNITPAIGYSSELDQNAKENTESITYGQGIAKLMKRVVLVQAGTAWGSGIIMDTQGAVVLTCRHVVKGALNSQVQVRVDFPRRYWTMAKVVYCTQASSAIDLAVLQIMTSQNLCLPDLLVSTDYVQGSDVCIIGHALFPRDASMFPSVTYGVLSNLVTVDEKPALIQSTCAVHSGASGGPLLCPESGDLLGIVASNSKDTDSGASFPHVNFSVPITAVYKSLQDFMNTSDVGCLQDLNACDESHQKIWKLQDDIFQDALESPKSKL
ncbi:peroxisomal leader peptide-processing protease-like [Ptychodera flava]|uniref:peroxisomal leader peptide-processing protease-like n=1 Tax=Ptychodera flava TaxID=63121 RepID=UPI00396A5D2A